MSLVAIFTPPSHSPVLAINLPVGYEWIVILAIGLLIFGKRLPGAARGIGQSILEFKKGIKARPEDEADEPAPRFDTRTGKPLA